MIRMPAKKCVGAVIYDDQNRIFLMTSPKWSAWVVPGGKIEEGETEEAALRREMMEELGIEITDIVKVKEKVKLPSSDFKDDTVKFIFIDFFARAMQTKITPNHELDKYGWFTVDEALKLNLLDSTRQFVEEFNEHLKTRRSP